MGLQSKLRLKKGGSGLKVSIGYGSPAKEKPLLIRNEKDFEKDCSNGVIFASSLGSKKTALLATKAKELGITVLNMKKVKKATRIKKRLDSKKKTHETKPAQRSQEEKGGEKNTKKDEEKKIGFDDDVVPEVMKGKTKTYRLRDHGLNVGDRVVFENTQKKEIFGHAKVTKVEKTTVEKFNLQDPEHYKVYNSMEELIAALKKRNSSREVTPKTEVYAYTYEFTPSGKS